MMRNMQAVVKTTPFWGEAIIKPLFSPCEKKDKEEEKKRKEKLNKLYEMVDDYIEQA